MLAFGMRACVSSSKYPLHMYAMLLKPSLCREFPPMTTTPEPWLELEYWIMSCALPRKETSPIRQKRGLSNAAHCCTTLCCFEYLAGDCKDLGKYPLSTNRQSCYKLLSPSARAGNLQSLAPWSTYCWCLLCMRYRRFRCGHWQSLVWALWSTGGV
jgi:hypothetical protein